MARIPRVKARKDAGFSMVEMLMAAFIFAIGLLGLCMLQSMSIRVAAGGHNLELAVQLNDQVMDQVELEGRQSYLNANITDQTAPSALATLVYINQAQVDQYFRMPTAADIDPMTGLAYPPGKPILSTIANYMFHVQMTQAVTAGTGLSDVTVTTNFSDATNAVTHVPVVRNVTTTRRIIHG